MSRSFQTPTLMILAIDSGDLAKILASEELVRKTVQKGRE